jgi:hypothetical protein
LEEEGWVEEGVFARLSSSTSHTCVAAASVSLIFAFSDYIAAKMANLHYKLVTYASLALLVIIIANNYAWSNFKTPL